MSTDRRLPIDTDMERDMIAALMLRPSLIDDLDTKANVFSQECYQVMHEAIRAVADQQENANTNIDVRLLMRHLRATQEIMKAGGSRGVGEMLSQMSGQVANAPVFWRELRKLKAKREILIAGETIADSVMDDDRDPQELVDAAEARIYAVQEEMTGGVRASINRMSEFSERHWAHLLELRNPNREDNAVQTPFRSVNNDLGGLRKQELCVIGARPGVGKTNLANTIALAEARRGKEVLYVSMEMSKEELMNRFLSSVAEVNNNNIRRGQVSDQEWERMQAAEHELRELPITIVDTNTLTLGQLTSICRRRARQSGVDLLVVDYLQLIWPDETGKREKARHEHVADCSRRMKGLAREMDCSTVVLAQLNRESAKGEAEPKLHELRESGAIEQDADCVMFLWKARDYDTEEAQARFRQQHYNEIQVSIAKNRHGPVGGRYIAAFQGGYSRFRDIMDANTRRVSEDPQGNARQTVDTDRQQTMLPTDEFDTEF